MKAPRLAAGAVVCSLAASQLAAPSAHAYETTYDTMIDTCTIAFSETDAERTNNAYSGLFLRLAEQVRDSFEGEQAKADAAIVYEYGSRADVKSASGLPIPADLTVSNAQARLALDFQKDKYWQMVGFINASKNDVITERTITMTPAKARKDGGVTYGVYLGPAIGGAVGGLIFGGEFADLRDTILAAAKTYAPEFAAPILSYSKAFEDCAERRDGSSSVLPGSSLTSSQTTALGAVGAILGIFSLVGLGFAIRPLVEQFTAGLPR